jgi:hypothetical protein
VASLTGVAMLGSVQVASAVPTEPSEVKPECAPSDFVTPPAGFVTYKCTAVVAENDAGGPDVKPTGTVAFYLNGINSPNFLGQCVLAPTPGPGGISECQVPVFTSPAVATGTQTIFAEYSGDATYLGSVGSDTVGQPASGPPNKPSDTSVLCAPSAAPVGGTQTLKCTALVADNDAGTDPRPTGTVGFFVDGINSPNFLGQCTLTALPGSEPGRGISHCTLANTSPVTVGAHTIYAMYFGDAVYAPSVDSDGVS